MYFLFRNLGRPTVKVEPPPDCGGVPSLESYLKARLAADFRARQGGRVHAVVSQRSYSQQVLCPECFGVV